MEPYVGEIRCFSFGRIPRGWVACNGQQLTIQQNQALYALIGNTFGGDGKTIFNVPNLNGVVPIHYNATSQGPNSGTHVGSQGGTESVVVNAAQIPAHTHVICVNSAAADQPMPGSHYPAVLPSPHLAYVTVDSSTKLVAMAGDIVSAVGGTAHPNMQPYLAVNFCMATQGYWPPRPD